jgi:hypothetical protein
MKHGKQSNATLTSRRKKVPLTFLYLRGIALALACLGAATQAAQGAALLAEHIEIYASGGVSASVDLPGCTNTTTGLVDEFDDVGWSETWWANSAAFESDFKSSHLVGGDDDNWADDADFTYFCGHGNTSLVEFTTFTAGDGNRLLFNNETRYGNVNAEWVTFDTSFTLRDTGSNISTWYANAFRFLHLLVGWHDSPLDGDTGGQFADELIDKGIFDGGGNTVQQAWFSGSGGCTDQNSGTTQSIIAEIQAHFNDRIWGEGSNAGDQPNNNLGWLSQNDC